MEEENDDEEDMHCASCKTLCGTFPAHAQERTGAQGGLQGRNVDKCLVLLCAGWDLFCLVHLAFSRFGAFCEPCATFFTDTFL